MRAFVPTALLVAALACAVAMPATAYGQASPAAPPALSIAPAPPSPTRWATDTVGVLSPTARASLDARLEAYQYATGHQVVLWIGDSIGDTPLDEWAVRTFDAWNLGRTGQDDGVALLVLVKDRKIAIEVGYGLEGALPDAMASRIINDVMAPRLGAGDYDGAMQAGIEAILAAIEGKPWPGAAGATSEAARGHDRGDSRPMPLGQKILFGLLAIGFLVLFVTNPRLAMMLLWSIVARGGGGSGGGGGGGRSGGSGGGFSGGGGRSGGGGARGGW